MSNYTYYLWNYAQLFNTGAKKRNDINMKFLQIVYNLNLIFHNGTFWIYVNFGALMGEDFIFIKQQLSFHKSVIEMLFDIDNPDVLLSVIKSRHIF